MKLLYPYMSVNNQSRAFKWALFLFVATCIGFIGSVKSHTSANLVAKNDSRKVENRIKSAYLYNFLKYMEFESNKEAPKDYFAVCVLGVDPFGDSLQKMHGKKAKGRSVQVKRMLDVSETDDCDIIYISQSKKLELSPVLKAVNTRSVLTVSDIGNFTQVGGIVRFIRIDKKIGIEINLTQARKSGIQISSLLLEIAKVVE